MTCTSYNLLSRFLRNVVPPQPVPSTTTFFLWGSWGFSTAASDPESAYATRPPLLQIQQRSEQPSNRLENESGCSIVSHLRGPNLYVTNWSHLIIICLLFEAKGKACRRPWQKHKKFLFCGFTLYKEKQLLYTFWCFILPNKRIITRRYLLFYSGLWRKREGIVLYNRQQHVPC